MREVPVLIAGGGPVGMTLAKTLASFGIECMLALLKLNAPPLMMSVLADTGLVSPDVRNPSVRSVSLAMVTSPE